MSDDDFFGDDFDDEIKKYQKVFGEMFKKIMKELGEGNPLKKPLVYGISFKIGPDGFPVIEDFGTVHGEKEVGEGYREPLTDIMDDENNIYVTIELPGVEKEDINIEFDGENLVVKVDTENRKFFKKIDLPENSDVENTEAKYNNGVLDITIKKKKTEKEKKKIPVR